MNSVISFYPSGEILSYQYIMDDVREGWWSKQVIPAGMTFNPLDSTEIQDTNGDFHIYVATQEGQVYEWMDADADTWVDADGNTFPIVFTLTTPYMRLGQLGRDTQVGTDGLTPEWIELRVREETNQSTTWTTIIETAEGSDENITPLATQTQTVTIAGTTGMSRKRVPPMTRGPYMRLTVKNEQTGVDPTLLGVRVYFSVQPFDPHIQ